MSLRDLIAADPLASYLAPKGEAPGIGPEKGPKAPPRSGIAKYVSPHGSTRYVVYQDARPVAALQVVSRDGAHASIANVFTDPCCRRAGLAKSLLTKARRDFKTVAHASEEMISDAGKAWRSHVDGPTMAPGTRPA
jgi:ribosomal protein S18 acetylase RimI-like enzyme